MIKSLIKFGVFLKLIDHKDSCLDRSTLCLYSVLILLYILALKTGTVDFAGVALVLGALSTYQLKNFLSIKHAKVKSTVDEQKVTELVQAAQTDMLKKVSMLEQQHHALEGQLNSVAANKMFNPVLNRR